MLGESQMQFIMEHLAKNFGTKEVLRDISFAFESGKIYGLLGRNGAGKTTLFQCLNGGHNARCRKLLAVRRPPAQSQSGRYRLCAFHAHSAGFLTGREFLKFFLEVNAGVIASPKTADDYFELVRIDPEDRDKLLKNYSHGMRTKCRCSSTSW